MDKSIARVSDTKHQKKLLCVDCMRGGNKLDFFFIFRFKVIVDIFVF